MFELPAYEDLSREQDDIFNLPLDGKHVVVGPPGTGKTVMAVYRAEMYKKAKNSIRFVVYNNTLNQYLAYSKQQKRIASNTSTLHKWFYSWHFHTFGKAPPQLEKYVFDWERILKNMMKYKGEFKKLDAIIIDEGQDFPREFYLVLQVLAHNITVFADENQRITQNNSTLQEIMTSLGVKQYYPLTRNYRNTQQIARLAQHFYADLESGIPKLPQRKGPKPKLCLSSDLKSQGKRIATYASNNKRHHIGVFVNTKQQQLSLKRQLEEITDVPIQTYINNDRYNGELDFSEPGIKIINYRSAKGLEFNTVFLPELDTLRTDADEDLQKMLFFVLMSRARDQLWLMSKSAQIPYLLQAVPNDLYEIIK